MAKKVEFTEKTRRAISSVSGELLGDMDARGARSKNIMAEVTLDGNRLAMNGNKEADAEVSALIKEHGWAAVKKAAAEFVVTA